MITEKQLHVGLVLWLDSECVEAMGATPVKPNVRVPLKIRPWLLVRQHGASYYVVPLYGGGSWLRVPIPMEGRAGQSHWVDHAQYLDPEQVWLAPASAIVTASVAGGDTSKTYQRNVILPANIPTCRLP